MTRLTCPADFEAAPCGTVAEAGPQPGWVCPPARLAVRRWDGMWETNHPDYRGVQMTSDEVFDVAGPVWVRFVEKKENTKYAD